MREFTENEELMLRAEEESLDTDDEEYENQLFEKVEEINELIKLRKLAEPKGDNRKVLLAVKGTDGNSSLVACKVNGKCVDLNLESKDKKVYGFSLLCSKKGEESVIPATAELIDDKTVSVDVPHGVGDVKELRYLWADSPAPVNLYSRNSLPAAPFRIIQG